MKNSKCFIKVDDGDSFDYTSTKRNVEKLFSKYRTFKSKLKILDKRY